MMAIQGCDHKNKEQTYSNKVKNLRDAVKETIRCRLLTYFVDC